LETALREQMLASATEAVNALCTWAHNEPMADFEAREERVLKVGRQLLATWLGELASAAGPRSPACPKCGVHSLNAVRRRRKPRMVNSRCGCVHIPRVRLTCRGCGHSWLPLNSVLGMAAKQRTSSGLQHWEALLGGLTTFAEAAQLLETLAGAAVGIETLRTHAEAAGAELEGEQRAAMAHVAATQDPPANYDPVATDQVLVVEADGVMARYRDRHLDGTLINGEWHEIKLGLTGAWHGDQLISPSYVAARETASQFAPRLGTEAARRGALDVVAWRGVETDGGGQEAVLRRVVVVGDGARWIWEHVATTFGSERVEILDWYHCCQHLGAVGAALHGAQTAEAEAWVNHAKDVIWQEGPDALLRMLAASRAPSEEATRTLETERGYFRTNAERMRYASYRDQGLPVGSGVVESAAKHLVQHRMKRAGMRWSELGARAILHLRCALLNHDLLKQAA
jgi:Uncharacterised protein family (UPF0236)